MTKPAGPICNFDCQYCYYSGKTELYPDHEDFRMTDEVLESFIQQYIEASPGPDVTFVWHGGEPTLLGVPFYRKAVALQSKHLPPGWRCQNAIQTNGAGLDAEWCAFLKEEGFLVGISIDGPAELHDVYRVTRGGQPTHGRVMEGLRRLQEYAIDYNVLCVVHNLNSQKPLSVYHFLKRIGATWIQFIPLIETVGTDAEVSDRSVSPKQYGDFLVKIFNEWVRSDVGRVFVQTFDECMEVWGGGPAGLCIHQETCGRGPVVERNGDVYSCDHYVFPEYKLGNIAEQHLMEIVVSERQEAFGLGKLRLPKYCETCDVRFMCNGGCPKHRFSVAPSGEPGLNYLCGGYRSLFRHVDPYMRRMAQLRASGRPASTIMAELRSARTRQRG